MAQFEGIELILLLLALLFTVPLLGDYMARVFTEPPAFALRTLGWLEKGVYRLCHIVPSEEMNWKTYAKALLLFNVIGLVFLFLLQMIQGWLPLNPQHLSNVNWALALNTAISFVSNTDWQSYEGETTLSYLTDLMGLTVQNFVSAASGNATLLALIRGIKLHSAKGLGNFWVDLTRTVVYILLPLSLILACFLVSQGVIQNVKPYATITTVEGDTQVIPQGPLASQVAIKQLGTNGGGVVNANSAHPFENPTPISNLLELFAIICIPTAATYMYGQMIGAKKQGFVILGVMLTLWLLAIGVAYTSEWMSNPVLGFNPVLEGKEMRVGIANSALWAITTTSTSSGSINSMIDSLSPLAGGMALFQMLLGEIVFGGIGVGLCGMLMYVFLTVFLAGLMVGRTPEYLGKKIEKSEIQWAIVAILTPCSLILLGTSIALLLPNALESLHNKGPHGLSELLYAFSSAAANNGSAFEGLNANTYFYNLILGLIMLITRLSIIIPSLAIAGHLVQKRVMVESVGTFKTDTYLFGLLLLSVILIVAALTFFPALALGPIAEQILLFKGQAF